VAREAATTNGLGTEGTPSPEVRQPRMAGPVGRLPTTSRSGEIRRWDTLVEALAVRRRTRVRFPPPPLAGRRCLSKRGNLGFPLFRSPPPPRSITPLLGGRATQRRGRVIRARMAFGAGSLSRGRTRPNETLRPAGSANSAPAAAADRGCGRIVTRLAQRTWREGLPRGSDPDVSNTIALVSVAVAAVGSVAGYALVRSRDFVAVAGPPAAPAEPARA